MLSDLEQAAQDRLEDAECLYRAARYPSAIASGLYALEIRLKVVICRRLDVDRLPPELRKHELGTLMLYAGLSSKIQKVKRPRFVYKNWNELLQLSLSVPVDQFRYRPNPDWNEVLAGRVLHQLRDTPHGLLSWLQKQR